MKSTHFKKLSLAAFMMTAALFATAQVNGAEQVGAPQSNAAIPVSPLNKPLKIAFVNFKTCVESSKMGKQEQATFESLKKQMETVLEEKEKALNDMAAKFNDPDYLDSLSAEAETEIKRKFRAQSQELSGFQNQYMQILQQTNLKVIQKLTEAATEASKKFSLENKIDIIFNEEAFYYSPDLDVSQKIISLMDKQFDAEAAEQKEKTPKL